jgi:hypothetical protein
MTAMDMNPFRVNTCVRAYRAAAPLEADGQSPISDVFRVITSTLPSPCDYAVHSHVDSHAQCTPRGGPAARIRPYAILGEYALPMASAYSPDKAANTNNGNKGMIKLPVTSRIQPMNRGPKSAVTIAIELI